MPKKSNFNQFFPIILLVFYLTIFPRIQEFLLPHVQFWVERGGVFSPFIYMSVGVFVTVVAPLGLGPINIVLQRVLGFENAYFYFFIYTTIGLMINFLLSKLYGKKLLHWFFPETKLSEQNTPVIKYLFDKFEYIMIKGNWKSFFVFLGGGNELLAYLSGTTHLRLNKFLLITIISNIINSFLLINRNRAISYNRTVEIFIYEFIFYFLSFVSIYFVVAPDLPKFKEFVGRIISLFKDYNQKKKTLKKGFFEKDFDVKKHKLQLKKLEQEFNEKLEKLFKK
jgi:uncharacterized membrane protein YdjX (TVP38/TMEM64 family)